VCRCIISLPQAVRRELDKVAKEEGVSRSDVLRQSLEDFLFVRRFRRLRQRMMAAAQAEGIYTDEDVFTRVS
jgi:metal-responsive CopG/Arc/MetJ family transcriptional regulator